jgi:hypothetical protein
MLDSLRAAGRAPSFVAVFVDDSTFGARIDDLGNREKFVRFVLDIGGAETVHVMGGAGPSLLDATRARWAGAR